MEPKLIAENNMGTSTLSCGGMLADRVLFRSSTFKMFGLLPRSTRVSIGSRSGSMEGFVTWLALSSRWSQ